MYKAVVTVADCHDFRGERFFTAGQGVAFSKSIRRAIWNAGMDAQAQADTKAWNDHACPFGGTPIEYRVTVTDANTGVKVYEYPEYITLGTRTKVKVTNIPLAQSVAGIVNRIGQQKQRRK